MIVGSLEPHLRRLGLARTDVLVVPEDVGPYELLSLVSALQRSGAVCELVLSAETALAS